MAYNPKGLLRQYVKKFHGDEIAQVRSSHQQSKVSIDYTHLNQYLLKIFFGYFDTQHKRQK